MRYGTSYFGNRILRHAVKDMQDLSAQGFRYVLLTFSEYDLRFHAGNMAEIVRSAKEVGLEVHMSPWGVGKVFGGEPFSDFVAQHYTDACQVLDNDRIVPLACPNAPTFRMFMQKWIETVINCGPDAVFWDEPHFHEQGFLSSIKGHWGCRCRYCREGFEEMYGFPMPREEDKDVVNFKKESIRDFIQDLTCSVKAAGLKNILYMTPGANVQASIKYWETLASNPYLDTLATGPYWRLLKLPSTIVEQYATALKALCDRHGKNAQIWLQCFLLPAGSESDLANTIGKVISEGVNDIAFWSYLASEHESYFRCENPEAIWREVTECVRKIKR